MRVVITSRAFRLLLRELRRRGKSTRESGAFLLSSGATANSARVTAVAFYDDLDPQCLTGGITFGADGYTALAQLCRARGLVVVGDVHTHPSTFVEQSDIDARSPMAAIPGHVAVIIPNYASGRITHRDIGVHEFLGNGHWSSTYGEATNHALKIEHHPLSPHRLLATLRGAVSVVVRRKGTTHARPR